MMSQLKESDTMTNLTYPPGFPPPPPVPVPVPVLVPEAPTSAIIEAIPVSVFPALSQPITPTIRRRRRKSLQPEYLEHWEVSHKQRPNGRTDTYYRHKELRFLCRSMVEVDMYEKHGIPPSRAKKLKTNKEEIEFHALPPAVIMLPWKDETETEAEAAAEKIENMNTSDPSASAAPKVKRERKTRVEKTETGVNWNDPSEVDLVKISITYVKEFQDYKPAPDV